MKEGNQNKYSGSHCPRARGMAVPKEKVANFPLRPGAGCYPARSTAVLALVMSPAPLFGTPSLFTVATE